MGTNITALLLALVTFSSIIAGVALFTNDFITIYNPSAVQDVSILTDTANTTGYAETSQTQLTNQGSQTLGVADVILTGGWSALITLVSLPGTITTLITNIVAPTDEGGLGIPLPYWFIGFIIAIVTIFVVYRIVGISTRTESGGI